MFFKECPFCETGDYCQECGHNPFVPPGFLPAPGAVDPTDPEWRQQAVERIALELYEWLPRHIPTAPASGAVEAEALYLLRAVSGEQS